MEADNTINKSQENKKIESNEKTEVQQISSEVFQEVDSSIIAGKHNIIVMDNRKESRMINLRTDSGEQLDEQMQVENKDNRNILSENAQNLDFDHQPLQKDQINELKNQNISKEKLIEEICANNKQLEQRTAFSKQKYLNRKKKQHYFLIMFLRPTLENIMKLYTETRAKDIGQDSFAYFLYSSNLFSGARVLLFDNTKGLGLAGVALRLGGNGKINMGVHPQMDPNQKRNACTILNQMNPDKTIQDSVSLVNTNNIITSNQKYTHLIIAGVLDGVEILELCENKLETGGTFCAYSPYIENLKSMYEFMLQKKNYLYMQITDSFMRTYQVLKDRSHPVVETSSFSGYVLRGVKVE